MTQTVDIPQSVFHDALLALAPYAEAVARGHGVSFKVKCTSVQMKVEPDRVQIKQDGHWIDVPLVDDEEIPS